MKGDDTMSLKDILVDIVVPLIAGFIGGSIGSVVIIKYKYNSIESIKIDKRKVNNNKALYQNVGEVTNGDKNR